MSQDPDGALASGKARLDHLQDQLVEAQRMDTINLLAGGVLHDFNNVLTAIMGHSAMLRQDAMLSSEHRQIAQDVLDAAQRASVLARHLLAYSRPRIRRPEIFDLNAVLVDLSRLLRKILGERIELHKRLSPELPPVELDRSEVEQAILNLVLNARDAMPDGGTLLIETMVVDRAAGQEPWIRLTVRDNGEGMEEKSVRQAFEPFFTTRQTTQHTGLGLTTVHKILAACGGTIELESEPGVGTICRIELPARAEATLPRPESTAPQAIVGGSETVLVVEDEAMARSTLVRALRLFGYEVLEAEEGHEALEIVAQDPERLDLMIADVIMPRMNGRELSQRVLEANPNVRVLFISGYSEDVSIQRGLLGKDVELLAKPFPPEVLVKKVRQMLDS